MNLIDILNSCLIVSAKLRHSISGACYLSIFLAYNTVHITNAAKSNHLSLLWFYAHFGDDFGNFRNNWAI